MRLPIDHAKIADVLCESDLATADFARNAIEKTRHAEILNLFEIASIIRHAPSLQQELFVAAHEVREAVYGKRMILFAPLYWSNYCVNHCLYCGFSRDNAVVERNLLSREEVITEANILASRGYRRILLESGEDPVHNTIDHLCDLISGLYAVRDDLGRSCFDRINVNIAATTIEDYQKLNCAGIGTYNLFQETYHEQTYKKIHPRGPKHNYMRQLTACDRALEAGIGDVGLGVLWGLFDWRFELLAMIEHARYLEKTFGIGPHTFSMPRIQPAQGVHFVPPYPVSDDELLCIISILRLTVPYAGTVISTRESAELRKKSFQVGITQISAGSSTVVGGYARGNANTECGQFVLGDHRSLEEVTQELLRDGFIPAFCTACEQRGRTGVNFTRIAKSGFIGNLCTVNSLLALKQYIIDGKRLGFVTSTTESLAGEVIKRELNGITPFARTEVAKSLLSIERGGLAKDEYI